MIKQSLLSIEVHNKIKLLFLGIKEAGNQILNPLFFDTITVMPSMDQGEIQHRARQKKINLRYNQDNTVSEMKLLFYCNK